MKSFTPLKPSDLQLRDWNPVRGLTIPRVVAAEEAAQRGDFVELQWLYQKVERKDAPLRGAKRRLMAAITKLDWDIKIPAELKGADLELAERQRKDLREAYDAIGNLRAALKFLVLAEFRGFAHLERQYELKNDRWVVTELKPMHQWHWCRDGIYGEWCWNPDASMGGIGMPVDIQRGFIVREVEDPINEIALKCFVLKNFAQKDWANFTEKFGIPFVYWLLSEGIAQSLINDPKKLAEWQDLLSQVTGDGTGIFPGGSLETLQGGAGASATPFKDFLESLDAETVMAATSGKLTMLNEATGLGSGNSEAHSDTFEELAQALAGEISETMQEQFDAPLLDERYPEQKHFAYFELASEDEEDVDRLVQHAHDLSGTEYALDPSDFAERTGYVLRPAKPEEDGRNGNKGKNADPDADPEEDDLTTPKNEASPGQSKMTNRGARPEGPAAREDEAFDAAAREMAAQALANDLAPMRALLNELLESDDDALVLRAATMLDQFDEEGERLLAEGGELSRAMESILATATVNGAEKAPKTKDL